MGITPAFPHLHADSLGTSCALTISVPATAASRSGESTLLFSYGNGCLCLCVVASAFCPQICISKNPLRGTIKYNSEDATEDKLRNREEALSFRGQIWLAATNHYSPITNHELSN